MPRPGAPSTCRRASPAGPTTMPQSCRSSISARCSRSGRDVMVIETARLLLRDWREADIDAFDRHTNTPNVMRWLGGVATRVELEDRLRSRVMRWQAERGFTFWAVERKADGELLGFCGLNLPDTAGPAVQGR